MSWALVWKIRKPDMVNSPTGHGTVQKTVNSDGRYTRLVYFSKPENGVWSLKKEKKKEIWQNKLKNSWKKKNKDFSVSSVTCADGHKHIPLSRDKSAKGVYAHSLLSVVCSWLIANSTGAEKKKETAARN